MESKTNTCVFDNINSSVLEKVCEYFYYYQKNIDARDVASLDIPAEMCLEVLMAADYLDSMSLHAPQTNELILIQS